MFPIVPKFQPFQLSKLGAVGIYNLLKFELKFYQNFDKTLKFTQDSF